MPRQRFYYKVISAAIFILLEIAALSMLSSSATLQSIWLNKVSFRAKAIALAPFEKMKDFISLKEQNRNLAQENFNLNKDLAAYRARLNAARIDSTGIANSDDCGFSFIPAQITKLSTNNQRNYFILNKGARDGVTEQSGVVTPYGVVGIVKIVDERYCYGFTIMNPEMNISVRIGGPEGYVSPMSWGGLDKNEMQLKDIPIHTTIPEGDTIFTSGLSTIFPKDIPIGLTGTTAQVNGSSNTVSVKLFQDFAKLRYVTIVRNKDYDEIINLERQQE